MLCVQVEMKKTNSGREEQLKTCWSTMLKYIGNIAKASLPALQSAMSHSSTLSRTHKACGHSPG